MVVTGELEPPTPSWNRGDELKGKGDSKNGVKSKRTKNGVNQNGVRAQLTLILENTESPRICPDLTRSEGALELYRRCLSLLA
jgi:hypothetical protein